MHLQASDSLATERHPRIEQEAVRSFYSSILQVRFRHHNPPRPWGLAILEESRLGTYHSELSYRKLLSAERQEAVLELMICWEKYPESRDLSVVLRGSRCCRFTHGWDRSLGFWYTMVQESIQAEMAMANAREIIKSPAYHFGDLIPPLSSPDPEDSR
jgi:hypothetical protein